MRNKNQSKLSLKKFQIAKINSPDRIFGGGDGDGPITPTNKTKTTTITNGLVETI